MASAQKLAAKTEAVRTQCCEKVLNAAGDIVDALITKSKEGSYQHAKFLFDLLEPATRRSRSDEDDEDAADMSLLEYLVKELQLEPPPDNAAPSSTGDSAVA